MVAFDHSNTINVYLSIINNGTVLSGVFYTTAIRLFVVTLTGRIQLLCFIFSIGFKHSVMASFLSIALSGS